MYCHFNWCVCIYQFISFTITVYKIRSCGFLFIGIFILITPKLCSSCFSQFTISGFFKVYIIQHLSLGTRMILYYTHIVIFIMLFVLLIITSIIWLFNRLYNTIVRLISKVYYSILVMYILR